MASAHPFISPTPPNPVDGHHVAVAHPADLEHHLPKEWEESGFGPGDVVLVERDAAGEIRMLRAGDLSGRIDASADEMVEKHAKALQILADHDAGSE